MSKYSPEFKEKIVREYLESTIGITSLASQYGLSKGMLGKWCKSFQIHGAKAFQKNILLIQPNLNLVFFNTWMSTVFLLTKQSLILI